MIHKILRGYGSIVANHPFVIITVVVLITSVAFIGVSGLEMKSSDNRDMLPHDIPSVAVMDFVEDEFRGTESGMVVIEIDPVQNGSGRTGEIRDVRDFRVIKYGDILAQKIMGLRGVSSAESIADILRELNNGRIPKSKKTIESLLEKSSQSPMQSPGYSNYISSDWGISLVRIGIVDGVDEEELVYQLRGIVEQTPTPPGIKAQITGGFAVSTAIKEQIGPDMRRTSMFSLVGLLVVILLLFRSIKHGLVALMAIVFGNVWAFGLMGVLGIAMSSQTAGASSMIMGIGIDFGIQVVSRFRQELKRGLCTEAMITTMSGVIIPMSTTTLAALIGFRAMSMGRITMLAELGTMMSIGVLCCMMAAITIVPSLLVIFERYLGGVAKKGRAIQKNEN